MPQKLILDVDTGTDDALALTIAALNPGLELVAATTVNGNVEVEYATENTLRVFDAINAKVPVYRGLDQPFVRPDFPNPRGRADDIHGRYLQIPVATSKPQPQHAVDFLIEYYMSGAGKDTILCPVGPLTNIAMALRLEPRLAAHIPEMVIMGGGRLDGNITTSPMAEYNIWCDPEGARVVFHSGVKITLVPLDVTRKALLTPTYCDQFEQIGTPGAKASAVFTRKLMETEYTHSPVPSQHVPMHDSLVVCAVIDRSVITTKHVYADVETFGETTVGQTVIDWFGRTRKEPNIHFAYEVDQSKYIGLVMESLKRTL
ncbi:MAG: nucleoside hydrolase [Anaerolineae bacterium]|nr:nucleoside hydrolase [Anaerolineae bacterium]